MKRELNITIYDKWIDTRYSACNGLYVGGILVATYGYNYVGIKGEKEHYVATSKIINIKGKTTFETEQQAKDAAYKIVDLFLKHLEK